jgi:iron complex outermembrane receptor protein
LLGAALALLDFEFKDYENDQCLAGQEPTSPDAINCDYSGKARQYVAAWAGNLLLAWRAPLADTFDLGISVAAIFTNDYKPSQSLDLAVNQVGY